MSVIFGIKEITEQNRNQFEYNLSICSESFKVFTLLEFNYMYIHMTIVKYCK